MIYTLKQKFIDNLIVFMLVMSSGGLLFVFNRNIMYGLFFIFIFIAIFFTSKKIKKDIFNVILATLILVISLFWINYSWAISEQSINKYQYYIMVVSVSALFLYHFYNNREDGVFLRRLYVILKLIVLHAFIQVIAYFVIGNNLTTITVSEYEYDTFNYIFYYSEGSSGVSLFGLELLRNQGLFWEPGVAQVFFNIFFFLEGHIMKRNKGLLIITAFVIMTTYSTAGIAILLIQLIYYFFLEMKGSKIIIPIMVIISIPIYSIFTSNLEEKISGDREASFQKRYFDLVQPFFIALQHPITGIGLDLHEFQEYRSEFYVNSTSLNFLHDEVGVDLKMSNTDEGSSNHFVFLLATMGFPTGLFFIFMLFKQKLITVRKNMLLSIIVLALMSSPLLLRPFFFVFIMSGIVHAIGKITSHKRQLA